MGHQKHRKPQGIPKRDDESVEGGSANRVQTGRGLIQKQDLRIKSQGSGQACTLYHAAGKLRRIAYRCIGGQAGQRQLHPGQLFCLGPFQACVLNQGDSNIFLQVQRSKKSAPLEEYAKPLFDL